MEKNILILLLIGLVCFALFTDKGKEIVGNLQAKAKPESEGTQDDNFTPSNKPLDPPNGIVKPTLNTSLVLQKGSKNNEVKQLQYWLNCIMYPNSSYFPVTGYFGSKTESKLFALTGLKSINLADAKSKYDAGVIAYGLNNKFLSYFVGLGNY
jgi:hypothetical protein